MINKSIVSTYANNGVYNDVNNCIYFLNKEAWLNMSDPEEIN